MSLAVADFENRPFGVDRREVFLWSGAAAVVLAAHLMGLSYFNRAILIESSPPEAALAVSLDLAPVAVAPEAVPTEMAELVDSIAAEPVEEFEKAVEPVPDPAPIVEPIEPEVLPETAEPAEPVTAETVEPVVETAETVIDAPVEEVVPDLVEVPLPEVALAVPAARPVAEEPKREPVAKPVKKKVTQKVSKKPAPPPSNASKKSATEASETAAPKASQGAAGKGMSPARWQSRVNAHLNRHKRYPSGASGEGSVSVRFAINQTGAVLSVSIARSSGDPALDRAALDLLRRASPIPAPPPSIARSRMSLTVPIRFAR